VNPAASVFGPAGRWFGVFRDPVLRPRGRWIALSALVGAVSGVGAILFDLAFRAGQWAFLDQIAGFRAPGSGIEGGAGQAAQHPWLLLVSLVAGGLVAGAIVFGLAPEAEGHGTDAVIKAFHHLRGKIRRRVPLVKSVASAITIGSGGSAGREGPIAQVGAGFGSFLADAAKLGDEERRILMMAGAAGGIGSIFRAPLGAALFSAEVLYSEPEFEYTVLLPGLISAITGYCIYSSYAGWGFLFSVPPTAFHRVESLPVYLALGIACAVVGALYPKVFYGVRDRVFRPLPIPAWTKPAVGALAVGVLALFMPQVMGMGYGYVQEAIDGKWAVEMLLLFVGAKILATSFTISSGGSGGVFAPSLVIGGMLGAAFGQAAKDLFPGIAPEPAACVMVGMGGFFAGVAKVPFASVIMVMEMTGSYGLLVPSLLVAAIAYLALPPRVSLYENQLASRTDSPAHLGSFAMRILRKATIAETWSPPPPGDVVSVHEDRDLASLVGVAAQAKQNLFPVVDEAGLLVGELSVEVLRGALVDEERVKEARVRDVMRPAVGPLVPGSTLADAAKLLADRRVDSVVVVSAHETRRVTGLFTRRDLVVAYGRHLEKLQGHVGAPTADERTAC
jgi:CIC family chloride channel protein